MTLARDLLRSEAQSRGASAICARNYISEDAFDRLLPAAALAIGNLANPESIARVARKNPDSIWLFSRVGDERPEGFQAWLPLNEKGRQQLLDGQLDLANPPDDCIVSQGEKPALLYIWATYTPGRTATAIQLVVDHFTSPRYRDVDMVSWAAGVRGERSLQRFGFEEGFVWQGKAFPRLWILRRSPEMTKAARPRYDTYIPGVSSTGIKVVHDISELMKVAAIRAATDMVEQNCPFDEEFDGNDFAASHLLAYVNGEPAGCMRVRCFKDFAKVERLAVRKEFRTTKTAFQLVRAAVDLCRAKGYGRIYGYANVNVLKFWRSFGFKLEEGATEFEFSGERYVEISSEFPPMSDAVRLDSGPMHLIRPEGRWAYPGVLEASR